jgi:thiol-disulfide isomerase/thioredoxin
VPIEKPANTQPSNLSFVGQRLQIKPGETNRLVWGDTERSVKGRIVPTPGDAPGNADPNAILIPEVPFKLGCLKLEAEGANGSSPVEYFFTFGDQDAFRVTGALPPLCRAELRVYAPPLMLGVGRKQVDFPAVAPGAGAATFDLGDIQVEPVRAVKIGDPAPLFEITGLDGAPLKLTDFRGACVLLHFWAAWCSPQLALLPGLQEVSDKYRNDPRLVLVGLSLDRNQDTARRYVRRNSMKGRQGYLGEWFHTSLPAEYGVAGIPSVVLIGPEGKILARDMALTGLAAAIEDLLDKGKTK